MAITYPRTIPSIFKVQSTNFVAPSTVVRTPLESGAIERAEIGPAIWRASLTSYPLSPAEITQMQAWWKTLGSGLKTFLAHDYAREYPIAYPTGFAGLNRVSLGAFDGTVNISYLDASSIRASNPSGQFPANFVLKEGDYVGLIENGKYSLHQVAEDVTGNSSGNFPSPGIPLTPPIATTVFTNAATAVFGQAKAQFIPDEDGFEGEPGLDWQSVTISGTQKLY